MDSIRLLIASDLRVYSEGLATRLANSPGFIVDGSVSNVDALFEAMERSVPNVVLIDVSMPDSLEAVRRVHHRWIQVKVIGLGVMEEEEVVIPCIEAGMAGYLPRDGSVEDLLRLANSVSRGETFASPRIVAGLFRRLSYQPARRGPEEPSTLSPRELQIAALLERGSSNKEIARELGIRLPTVKKHVHVILTKLNIQRRAQVGATLRERYRRPFRPLLIDDRKRRPLPDGRERA